MYRLFLVYTTFILLETTFQAMQMLDQIPYPAKLGILGLIKAVIVYETLKRYLHQMFHLSAFLLRANTANADGGTK